MSRFKMIEIEATPSGSFPDYGELDVNRKTEFRIYRLSQDECGNKYEYLLMSTPNIVYAKKFLKSCQLIDGIEIT